MFPGAQHLQNLHPLVIHFPIALLVGAALLYLAAGLLKRDRVAHSAFVVLVMGALSLAGAVATGLYAEQGVMLALSVREHLLQPHKTAMLATLAICTILTIWAVVARPFPKKGRLLFLFLLLVMIGVMTAGADFGGRMVYDYNAGGSACHQPIQFTQ